MNATYGASVGDPDGLDGRGGWTPAHGTGVSWGAIFAGAAGAAALSLILLILGTGLGLSSVSPWAQSGIDAGTFGVSAIVWITFTQLAASGMGGYLAGRLRSKWIGVHGDETYFRDTAHGFLAWAVATLVTAAMLTSAIGSIVSGGAKSGAAVASGAASTAMVPGAATAAGSTSSGIESSGYLIDSLFRKTVAGQAAPTTGPAVPAAESAPASAAAPATPTAPTASATADAGASTAEVARIFANGLSSGAALPADDVKYVGQVVAQRTGISQADAEKRVSDAYAKAQAKIEEAKSQAKDAADKARKASAYAALWLFVSLLAGAFVASLSATYGGRRRDV